MSSTSQVLGYDRPLLPGTVRITRGLEGAVTIAVAPDTARRTLYTLTRPLILGAAFCAIPLAISENSVFPASVGIAGFVIIAVLTARSCFRIAARSTEAIIFRADAGGIHVVNPLGTPADRFYGADEVIGLRLNRISLIGEDICFQLELQSHTFWPKTDQDALLVSANLDMLDMIGRTLVLALGLPELQADPGGGWTSLRVSVRDATTGGARLS